MRTGNRAIDPIRTLLLGVPVVLTVIAVNGYLVAPGLIRFQPSLKRPTDDY